MQLNLAAPRGAAAPGRGRPGTPRVAALGALPQRAPMGHRARGLHRADGDAWEYFPHDHARSRAYRWGEDGIAGFSDDQRLPVPRAGAVERPRSDPQGAPVRPDQREGNHGEDVKELYYYLDGTPTPLPKCGCSTNIRRPRFPTTQLVAGEPAARRRRAGVRAARHRRLRRRPLLRRRRSSTPRPAPTTF